jgi:hypothetical protein
MLEDNSFDKFIQKRVVLLIFRKSEDQGCEGLYMNNLNKLIKIAD